MFLFFFKPKTAYERRISDVSSDVCSSDLQSAAAHGEQRVADEDRAVVREMIGDMPRGMRGHVPHVGDMRAEPHPVAARHQPVGGRDAFALGGGGDDLAARLTRAVGVAAGVAIGRAAGRENGSPEGEYEVWTVLFK